MPVSVLMLSLKTRAALAGAMKVAVYTKWLAVSTMIARVTAHGAIGIDPQFYHA